MRALLGSGVRREPVELDDYARAWQIARHMLIWGRPIPLDEIVGKIEAVTVESARAAGCALIARSRPAVAALGPGTGLESAAAIAETLHRQAA